MQDINQALLLLLVGMLTVFLILSLVVFTGWGLIRFTNNLIQSPKKAPKAIIPSPIHRIPRKQLAAIAAAIEIVTEGKVTIEKIEKV